MTKAKLCATKDENTTVSYNGMVGKSFHIFVY